METTSPSFSGIESKYNEPIDSKFHVDTLATAIGRDVDYNHLNMVIFVRDEKAFYVLKDGNSGNQVTHWQKITSETSLFAPFNAAKLYTIGETSAIGINMFINISASTTAGQSPITNPEKWLQVGATAKFKIDFVNQTEFTFTHNIANATAFVYDTITGVELGVLITKTAPNEFRIGSNQSINGTVIVS